MKSALFIIFVLLAIKLISQIPTNGLIAYYPFTNNTQDVSSNNYNATVNGPVLTADRFGNMYSAYFFDGIDDIMDLSSFASNFNFQQPVSFSFWVKTKNDDCQAIFSLKNVNSGTTGIQIAIGNNCTGTLNNELAIASRNDGSYYYITGFTTLNRNLLFDPTHDNNWHHFVYVFDGNSTKIYLDNVLLNLTCNYGYDNGTYGNIAGANKVTLGARYATSTNIGAYYMGSLDDIRIYNVVLNSSDISALFNEIPTNTTILSDTDKQQSIYPNPCKSYIKVDAKFQGCNYEIYELSGKMISFGTLENNLLNTNALQKGIYILKLSKGQKVIREKLIKN